jgi:hypothetical protein
LNDFESKNCVFFTQQALRRVIARAHRRHAPRRAACADHGASSGGELLFVFKMKQKIEEPQEITTHIDPLCYKPPIHHCSQ